MSKRFGFGGLITGSHGRHTVASPQLGQAFLQTRQPLLTVSINHTTSIAIGRIRVKNNCVLNLAKFGYLSVCTYSKQILRNDRSETKLHDPSQNLPRNSHAILNRTFYLLSHLFFFRGACFTCQS